MSLPRPVLLAALTLAGCTVALGPDEPTPTPASDTPTEAGATPTEPGATGPQATPSAATTPTRAPTEAPTPTEVPPTDIPETPTEPPTPRPAVSYALTAEAGARYDSWGVPHITAANLNDALFMQGYLSARDRLWEMDMFRRTAWGTTAEILGEGGFDTDLFTRTLYLGPLAEQIATTLPSRDPEVWAALSAYSAGVNAFMDDARSGARGASFSPQILAMGYEPDPWHPVDCLALDKLQTYALSSDHTTEVELGLAVLFLLSDDLYLDLFMARPLEQTAIVPGYYDAHPPEGARAPAPATREAILAARHALKARLPKMSGADALAIGRKLEGLKLPWQGSNNWVISGDLTERGHPIIASDTHEGVEAPATYWQAHLKALDGSIDAIGYTFPGIPFIAFGHNERVAWAPTTNFVDVTDVFIEDYNRRNNTVRSFGQPVPVDIRTERFQIRKEGGKVDEFDVVERELKYVPHHGPVLPEELVLGFPITLSAQWTGHDVRHSYRFLWAVNTMQSFEDLQEAQRGFLAGAVNMVYADVDGNIGYTARADVPKRGRIDPANPPYLLLPGTGDYDWTGEVYPDSWIPWAKNPDAGFVVTANNDPAGGTFDNDPTNDAVYLAGAYDSGTRAHRITALLSQARDTGDRLSLEDNARIQTDDYSQVAARTLPYLLDARARRPELVDDRAAWALDVLSGWDLNSDADAVAPLLFHGWLPYAMKAMLGDDLGDELFDDLDGLFVHVLIRPFVWYLDVTAEDIASWDPPVSAPFPSQSGLNYFDDVRTGGIIETRDQILLGALDEALDQLEAAYGASETWSWGRGHQITFSDPVGAALPEASSGPWPEDGGLFTVDVADFRFTRGGDLIAPFDVGNGPSNRYLMELDPEGIRAMDVMPGGQSERPGDEHFMDQVSRYVGNEYRGQPYYEEEIAADTEDTVTFSAGFGGGVVGP